MTDLDASRAPYLKAAIERLYIQTTIKALWRVRRLPGDIWQDFKYQVREGEGLAYDMYEEAIKGSCVHTASTLDPPTQALLWLWSDGFIQRDEDEGDNDRARPSVTEPGWKAIPFGDEVEKAVGEELWKRIYEIAETDDCPEADSAVLSRFLADLREYGTASVEDYEDEEVEEDEVEEDEVVEDEVVEDEEATTQGVEADEPAADGEPAPSADRGAQPALFAESVSPPSDAKPTEPPPQPPCACQAADPAKALEQMRSMSGQSLEDESHFTRALCHCPDCGRYYLTSFYEEIDWDDGDDSQASVYYPVTAEEARAIRENNGKNSALIDRITHQHRRQLLDTWPRAGNHNLTWVTGPMYLFPCD